MEDQEEDVQELYSWLFCIWEEMFGADQLPVFLLETPKRVFRRQEEEDLIETGSYWVANERLPKRPVGQRQEEIGVVRLQPETQTIIFSILFIH